MGNDPGLPFKLGRCSNGEFVPPPLDPVRREAMRRANELSEQAARRLGLNRTTLYNRMESWNRR